VAARIIVHLQHFLCGERTQQENRIHTMGSDLPFAALCTKVRYGPKADLPTRPVWGASQKMSL